MCAHLHTHMYASTYICTLTDSLWATHSCCLIHFSFSALALGNLLEQHMHTHTYACVGVYVLLFSVCFCFGSLLYCCRPSSPSVVVVFRQFFAHVRLKRLKQRGLSCDIDKFRSSSRSCRHLINRTILGLSVRQIRVYTHTHTHTRSICASGFVAVKLN